MAIVSMLLQAYIGSGIIPALSTRTPKHFVEGLSRVLHMHKSFLIARNRLYVYSRSHDDNIVKASHILLFVRNNQDMFMTNETVDQYVHKCAVQLAHSVVHMLKCSIIMIFCTVPHVGTAHQQACHWKVLYN